MMNDGKKIIVNTAAQYSRTFINTCLSLYTVRLVLNVLGQDDYGIYALVASIVAMLGFLTNAMVVTTQRHLSYSYGKEGKERVRQLFSNSVLMHIAISLLLVAVLFPIKGFIFSNYLQIADDKRPEAMQVYLLSIVMLFVTFNNAPFKALYIARENIAFISCVEVFDGFLKLGFALLLSCVVAEKLPIYALMMLAVQVVQFLAFSLFAIWKFEECSPRRFWRDSNRADMKLLAGFAGWTTYGTGSIVLRNQGLAIVMNHYLGTAVNAAYGISQQIYANLAFLSSSIVNAMNPQLMKAEGSGDRQRMLLLAQKESKVILVILSLVFIPLSVEMPNLLSIWLGSEQVNLYTVPLCQCMMFSLMIDQATYGLHAVMQAVGRIRNYTLLMYTPKILLLFVMWGVFENGYGIRGVLIAYMSVEALVALMRIPYVKMAVGLNVGEYLRDTIVRVLPLMLLLAVVSWGMNQLSHHTLSFLWTIPTSVLLGVLFVWKGVLSKEEQEKLCEILKKKRR